jgi:hypothetical protein
MLLGEILAVVGTTARPVEDYEGESLGGVRKISKLFSNFLKIDYTRNHI